jgi:hypothetical protein
MLLSPSVGDLVYNLSSGGMTSYHRRMRVIRVTAKQVTTIDQMGRRTTYWRDNGFEVGNKLNRLTCGDPPDWSKEPKHLINKPDPEVPVDA